MIKNMEWGALAYLSQSQYGKNGNPNYTGANKVIYINNYKQPGMFFTQTGCSSGSPNARENTTGCAYPYPSLELEATGASTTGTIYGIYDMSGGKSEAVMGNLASDATTNYNNHTMNVNYADTEGIFSNPNTIPKKYFDIYANSELINSYRDYSRGYLGDATKETLKTFGSAVGGWYGDFANFPYADMVWILRGGSSRYHDNGGIFYMDSHNGDGGSGISARPILLLE